MAYLLSIIKLEDIVQILSRANIFYILISLALSGIASLLLVYRWSILLRIFFPEIRIAELAKLYWKSQFFGLFLPGTIGGDIFRMYEFSKRHGEPVQVILAGLTDRLLGLVAIVLLATFAFVLGQSAFGMEALEHFKYLFGFFWAIVAIFLVYIFLFPKTKYVHILFKYFRSEIMFHDISKGAGIYKRQIWKILMALLVSLLVTAAALSATYSIALAVGIRLSPGHFYFISALSFLGAALPVSINGIGLSDGVYVFFLGRLGVPATAALSLSLTTHFVRYFIGSFGGLLFIFERNNNNGKPRL